MDRITHASVDTDLFGLGKDGFSEGDPINGVEATVVTADFMNGVQEEVLGVIEGAGLNPDEGDLTQLLKSVQAMFWRSLYALDNDSDSIDFRAGGGTNFFEEGGSDVGVSLPANSVSTGTKLKIKMRARIDVGASGTPPNNVGLQLYFDNATTAGDNYNDAGESSLSYALSGEYICEYEIEISLGPVVSGNIMPRVMGVVRRFEVDGSTGNEVPEVISWANDDMSDGQFAIADDTEIRVVASASGGTATVTGVLEYLSVDACGVITG